MVEKDTDEHLITTVRPFSSGGEGLDDVTKLPIRTPLPFLYFQFSRYQYRLLWLENPSLTPVHIQIPETTFVLFETSFRQFSSTIKILRRLTYSSVYGISLFVPLSLILVRTLVSVETPNLFGTLIHQQGRDLFSLVFCLVWTFVKGSVCVRVVVCHLRSDRVWRICVRDYWFVNDSLYDPTVSILRTLRSEFLLYCQWRPADLPTHIRLLTRESLY